MNDDFLKQYRKQPDQAFTGAVYRKISMEKRRVSTMKKLVFALVAFLAVLGFTLSVSPRARGAALELIREVGGLRFMETSDYPGIGESEEIVDSKFVTLEEAIIIFPGTISLPTVLPDGFNLESEVELVNFPGGLSMAALKWLKSSPDGERSGMSLSIFYIADNVVKDNITVVVGDEAIEEININGKPAALLRGGWNYDTKSYDPGIPNLGVRWEYDERTIYELNGSDEAIEPEVLIRIAESIK